MKVYDSKIEALDSVFTRMEDDRKSLRNDGLLLQKNFIVRLQIAMFIHVS